MFLCAYTHQEDQAQTKIAVRQWVELVFCAVSWNLFSRGWWIKNATFSDQVSPGMQWKVHQSEDCRKVGSFSVKFRGFGRGRGGIFVNLVALAIVKSEACSLARLQQWSFTTTTRSDVGGRSCASVSAIECQFSRGLGWECVCVCASFGEDQSEQCLALGQRCQIYQDYQERKRFLWCSRRYGNVDIDILKVKWSVTLITE